MARSARNTKLDTRTSRLKIPQGERIYATIGEGFALGYRRTTKGYGTWEVRYRINGKYSYQSLGDADDYQERLGKLRDKIDEFDAKLLDVIGKRMKVSESIGALKKEKNVAVLQNKRWNEILDKMIHDGSQKGLSEEFIIQFFKAIHQESITHQEKIFNQ